MAKIVVISGPSGAGKSTVCNKILEMFPKLVFSISVTTRKKRDNEKEGADYYFVDKKAFKKLIKNKEFIEWEEIYGDLYGTRRKDIEKIVNENAGVLMDIDPKGGLNIKKHFPDSLLIFLTADSINTLIERLKKRNTEEKEDIENRLKRVEEEFKLSKYYEFIIENNNLEDTLKKISKIIKEKIFSNE